MIDVFIRFNSQNRLRYFLALACLERWLKEPGIKSTILITSSIEWPLYFPNQIKIGRPQFWTKAKQYAEDHAQSGIYVVADDDQLILGENWIKRGVTALENNSEYQMLAAWSINDEHHFTEAQLQKPIIDMTHSSIGCPYFIYRGVIQQFPEANINRQDIEMCNLLRNNSHHFGFITDLRYNHLGYKYSTANLAHWNKP